LKNELNWTVSSSTNVVRNQWISLRADNCVTPSQIEVAPYYVLEYPDWVSIFALNSAGEVIRVSEYHHGAGVYGFGLPGGSLADESESPEAAAVRELHEETGFVAAKLVNLGAVWANWGNHTNRVHMFLATDCYLSGQSSPDESESISVETVSIHELRGHELAQAYHRLNFYMAMDQLRNSGAELANEAKPTPRQLRASQ